MSATPPEPLLPAYGGACLSSVVPALLDRTSGAPAWLPEVAAAARQVVLLVLDGLGWEQLQARPHLAPVLNGMAGGAITSVVPTTTATALTSITTGLPPAAHGVVGYRVKVGANDVLNVLRWTTAGTDAREAVPPEKFQPQPTFAGTHPPVVTRAEFATTGFTAAHLFGARLQGWRMPSALTVHVRHLLRSGEQFVYAYYDGMDKVAHERGFGEYYDAELVATDRLVADLVDALPPGAALVVTSDHGQVQVGESSIAIDAGLMEQVELLSGEGRFRWLHARAGAADTLAEEARGCYGEVAWVRTREELVEEGWLGGRPAPEVERRLGDVALIAFEPVAFDDPADTGESRLVCRHGSLTADEALVPLLACAARGMEG
ncbi:MAG TPA: alkaline phosphatase family protein [Acidimicrobiales bacterium]|nr:alkaline phosphatase family protein [Acidimicrobiales bacterium]